MFKGAILIILMAMLAGSGYFFAAQYDAHFGGTMFASIFQEQEKPVEEIAINDIRASQKDHKEQTYTQTIQAKNQTSCAHSSQKTFLHEQAIINEVAWMGTHDGANNEWIELYNTSDKTISLDSWTLRDKDEQINIIFPAGTTLVSRGFYLLAREKAIIPDVQINLSYVGGLRNSDETLQLFDHHCALHDEIIAGDDWPAGDNKEKKTMERGADLTWHTSSIIGGTPGKKNTIATMTMTMTTTTMTITTTTIATTTSAVTKENVQCVAENNIIPSRAVLINEIAWAGTAADKTSHEWIELRNTTGDTVHLQQWQLHNKNDGINIIFEESDTIVPYGYFLLERTDDDALLGIAADKIFVGAIRNSDEFLKLFDGNCKLIDEATTENSAQKEWFAGTTLPDYRTMERSADLFWHTYNGSVMNGIFGTPKTDNSPVVVLSGGSSGDSSSPPPPPPPPPPPLPQTGHILISEVMVGIDGNSDYEFVEIYNTNSFDITLTGWSLKKKNSSGTESSLVTASRLEGKMIKAGKYFLLAQESGYTGSIAADIKWPTSYSLAYTNNTLLLYNANGEKIDEANWTEIPKGQSFERDSWQTNQFHIQPIPNPQNSLYN